jgi:hypothetical protein
MKKLDDAWTETLPWLGQYVLDEAGNPMPATSLRSWGEWLQNGGDQARRVAKTTIGDVWISTVFLALDHSHYGLGSRNPLSYKPVLWETMIFGGPHDGYQERYSSREAAIEGHRKAVQLVEGGGN